MLLIDNYDSFAHNLARYFQRLGQQVQVIRNDRIDADAVLRRPPRAIVISPGPATPDDAGECLEIVRRCHATVPILGVCLGHQVLAQAFGARIVRAPFPVHGRSSEIQHDDQGVFAGLPKRFRVGRYHSLIVQRDSLPNDLHCLAETDDGTVMALQHTNWPLVGLQFHPESVLTEHGFGLLASFLAMAGIDAAGGKDGYDEHELPSVQPKLQRDCKHLSTGALESHRHPVTF